MYIPKFRHIREEVGVYLVYSGLGRRFFDDFRARRAIFLQLPAFSAAAATFNDDSSIIRHLHMSRAWNAYLRGSTSSVPSRNARSYPAVAPSPNTVKNRAFINDFASVKLMFSTIKVGDIVMVTPEGHYKELLIGEVQSNWNPRHTLELETFQGESVPYREVRWLNVALSRRDFPLAVAKRLQNRRAVTRIDDDLYSSIFRLIYSAFIWGNESKLDIYAPEFGGNDPLQIADAAFLIKWSLAAYAAYTKGQFVEFQSLPIEEAAERFFDPIFVEAFSLNFSSPGVYKLVGAGGAIGLVVASLVSLAISEESQSVTQVKTEIITELQQQNVPTTSDLSQQQISDLVSSLDARTADELRSQKGRSARNQLGLTLDSQKEVRRARERLAGN